MSRDQKGNHNRDWDNSKLTENKLHTETCGIPSTKTTCRRKCITFLTYIRRKFEN